MNFILFLLLLFSFQSSATETDPKQELKQQLLGAKSDSSRSALLLDLAKRYYSQDQDTALELSRQSLQISQKEDFFGLQASAHNLMGVCYLIKSDYEQALEAHFNALKIRESLKDSVGIMESYLNLGNIYYRLNDLELAVKQYKTSLAIAKKLGHDRGLSLLYNNLGSYYRDAWLAYDRQEDFDQALEFLEQSLLFKEKFGDEAGQIQTLLQLTDLYEAQPEGNKSFELMNRALMLSRKNENDEGLLSSLNRLSQYQKNKGEIGLAIQSSMEAFELAKQIQSPFQIGIAAKQLSGLYKLQGNYKKAFEFLEIDQQNADSVFNESREKIREELSSKYENEKKELEIRQMQQAEALNALDSKRKGELLMGALIVGVLLLFLLGLQWRNNRNISLANQSLTESNALVNKQAKALKESNQFREKLFSVISHDLRAPIASLNAALELWRLGGLDEAEINQVLQNISKETANTSGMLQNILIWARTQMEEDKLENKAVNLNEIVESIQSIFSSQIQQKNISFFNLIPDSAVVVTDRERLTLILRNLISNALKFTGDHGIIRVSSKGKSITVWDNGVGMSAQQQQRLFAGKQTTAGTLGEKGTGIGLLLTKDFAESIGVDIRVSSAEGEGSAFILTFP